jgi:transposase
MLVVERIARIRREHFVKGRSIKEIARGVGVSRNTVYNVLRSGATSFECKRNVQPDQSSDNRGVSSIAVNCPAPG